MTVKPGIRGILNVLARVLGLAATALGICFAVRGIYYLVVPEAACFAENTQLVDRWPD